MTNVLKFKQPDGSVKFRLDAPVYRHTYPRTKHKKGDLMPLRIPTKMLKLACVHPGDSCKITIRRITTNG